MTNQQPAGNFKNHRNKSKRSKKHYFDEDDILNQKHQKRSHDQYSREYLESTLWMQKHNPFDYRRKERS